MHRLYFVLALAAAPLLPGQSGQQAVLIAQTASASTQPPAGMALWLSADCITYTSSVCGVPSNGSTVTVWADRSGNANDATRTTGTCTFNTSQINSQPALTFSSCGLDLASGISETGRNLTVFVVYKNASTGGSNDRAFIEGGASRSLLYYSGGGNHKEQALDVIAAETRLGTAAIDTNWHQANLTFSSAPTYAFRLDRAADGSSGATFTITDPTLYVGYNSPNTNFFDGQMAEIIYYTSVLTGPQITQVETYLNAKYGL